MIMNARTASPRQRPLRYRSLGETSLHQGSCSEIHEHHLLLQTALPLLPGQAIEVHILRDRRLNAQLTGYAEVYQCDSLGPQRHLVRAELRAIRGTQE